MISRATRNTTFFEELVVINVSQVDGQIWP